MNQDSKPLPSQSETAKLSWTQHQQLVIDAPAQNILVNAGAGAGKTATMIERIYRLVSDEDNPTSLRRMLIVTFTRAAAAQMKDRLSTRLQKEIDRLRDSDIEYDLERHLELEQAYLPQANISTLHSFCMEVLQDYGHLIGLAPDFELMDEGEETLFRTDFLSDFLDTKFQDESLAPCLNQILQNYHPISGYDLLSEDIIRLQYFLASLPSPESFLKLAMKFYDQCADLSVPIDEISILVETKKEFAEALSNLGKKINDLIRQLQGIERPKGIDSYYKALIEKKGEVLGLHVRLASQNIFPSPQELGGLPRKFSKTKAMLPEHEIYYEKAGELKEFYDSFKKPFEKIPEGMTLDSLRHFIASQQEFVQTLLEILAFDFLIQMEELCLTNGRLTFNQLERLTLRLLHQNPDVRDQYRQKFDHVFVDEFQDINPLQSALLKEVSRPPESTSHPGNLFAVGDVKQSIYGFRQADPGQFLNLLKSYQNNDSPTPSANGLRIDLVENFRSAPNILSNLNQIFASLFSEIIGGIEFDESHAFVPGKKTTEYPQQPNVEVHFLNGGAEKDSSSYHSDDEDSSGDGDDLDLDKVEREAFHLARMIYEDCIVEKKSTLSETAIIIRKAKGRTQSLAKALRHYEIPFVTNEAVGFFSEQEITDCINLLRVINNPLYEIELIGTLRGPTFNWSEDELLELRFVDQKGYLFENLKILAKTKSLTAPKAEEAASKITAWQLISRQENMGDFLNLLYRDTNLIEIHNALANGSQRVQNLLYLRDQAVAYDHFSRKGLHDFLRYLDCLLEKEKSPGEPPNVSENQDALTILTIHKSKGLEFDTVYFPFLNEKFNMQDLNQKILCDQHHGISINFAPSLLYGEKTFVPQHVAFRDRMKDTLLSEELRLLYVATTRAERRLIITYSDSKMNERIEKSKSLSIPTEAKIDLIRNAKTLSDLFEIGLSQFPSFKRLTEEQHDITDQETSIRFVLEDIKPIPQRDADTEKQSPAEKEKLELDYWKRTLPVIEETSALTNTTPYRAKISATEAKRLYESVHHEQNPTAEYSSVKKDSIEWWPSALQKAEEEEASNSDSQLSILDLVESNKSEQKLTGSEKGNAYHRFLSLLKFEEIKRGRTLEDEAKRMISEGLLSKIEIASINMDSVELFLKDSIPGQAMINHPEHVYRELPFTCLFQKSELFSDQKKEGNSGFLLQGIVDVLFLPPSGVKAPSPFILDFKTDHWQGTKAHFDELVQRYQSQLRLYQIGLEKSYRQKIDDCYLYFFDADQSHKLVFSKDDTDWKSYLRAGYQSV